MADKTDKPQEPFVMLPLALFEALETGEIDRNEFMVYTALKTFVNSKTGEAFPGYDRLTRRCGLTNKPVGRAIRSLERKGWLERRKRFNNSAVYRLKTDGPRLETCQSETSDPSSPRLETLPVREHVSTNQINRNQIDNNQINENTPVVPKGDGVSDGVALSIYEAYPRKTRRDRAMKAIRKRLKDGVDPDYLLERTKAYAAAVSDKERRYIPHPATWFNDGGYDDDPAEWNPDAAKPPKNWRKYLERAEVSLPDYATKRINSPDGRSSYDGQPWESLPEPIRKEIVSLAKETDYSNFGDWGGPPPPSGWEGVIPTLLERYPDYRDRDRLPEMGWHELPKCLQDEIRDELKKAKPGVDEVF